MVNDGTDAAGRLLQLEGCGSGSLCRGSSVFRQSFGFLITGAFPAFGTQLPEAVLQHFFRVFSQNLVPALQFFDIILISFLILGLQLAEEIQRHISHLDLAVFLMDRDVVAILLRIHLRIIASGKAERHGA